MSIALTQNFTAVIPGVDFVQFVATGGSPPYTYNVIPGGSGGSIDPSTGQYTAASSMSAYPATGMLDQIQVTDSLAAVATATILVATPLFLLCDILKTQLNIPSDHIYVWNQKIFQPTDSDLYVVVSEQSCKPFGNSLRPLLNGAMVEQYISMYSRIDIDILSRGPAARDKKDYIPLALNSVYSQQQQDANSFSIGRVPLSFINLSNVDGAAIPYRYKITVGMQYFTSLSKTVPYFDNFQAEEINTDS